MMKSSSTLLWLVLSALQESNNRADPSKLDNVPANDFMPMSIDFLQQFPQGGVFKNHAPIEHENDKFLKQTGCKYVVMLRHPADHLAGLYCHQRGLPDQGDFPEYFPPERRTPWLFSAAQYPTGCFKGEPETAIHQLIECGYLFKMLIWMADWIAFRHPKQSSLLRYEDIISDFEKTVTDLCWFIRNAPPDDDLMRYLMHVFHHETTQGRGKSSRDNYPHGWTGYVGTWRDYFSAKNAHDYNVVVGKFIDAYPQASGLLDVYPNLSLSVPSEAMTSD
jgi:hypothetical protein